MQHDDWGFFFWGFKSAYVTHNNPDYCNNIRNIIWSQAWLRGHDGPGQICTHPVQQNIFSAWSQEHIVSCPGDAASRWMPVFHKPCFLFYRTFYGVKSYCRRKKITQTMMHSQNSRLITSQDRQNYSKTLNPFAMDLSFSVLKFKWP